MGDAMLDREEDRNLDKDKRADTSGNEDMAASPEFGSLGSIKSPVSLADTGNFLSRFFDFYIA